MSPNEALTEEGLTRRDFAWLLAAVSGGAALTGATAAADEPAKPAITQEQAIEAIIRQRFGKHLTEDQVRRLTQRVANLSRTADALKRVPLTNADEPAVVFRAD